MLATNSLALSVTLYDRERKNVLPVEDFREEN